MPYAYSEIKKQGFIHFVHTKINWKILTGS